jgi:hypothetical protein
MIGREWKCIWVTWDRRKYTEQTTPFPFNTPTRFPPSRRACPATRLCSTCSPVPSRDGISCRHQSTRHAARRPRRKCGVLLSGCCPSSFYHNKAVHRRSNLQNVVTSPFPSSCRHWLQNKLTLRYQIQTQMEICRLGDGVDTVPVFVHDALDSRSAGVQALHHQFHRSGSVD